MRFFKASALLAASVAVAPVIISSAANAEETRLPGHRAVYELTAAGLDGESAIASAEGRYVFDLEDFCEGYTLNERLVVRMNQSGNEVLTDYRLTAFESEDGALYRFATETSFNGRTGQEAEGTLSSEGEGSEIDYKTAEDKSFDEAVLPPLAHIRAVLDAARAGEARHAARVFDGDVEKPVFFAVTRMAAAETEIPKAKGTDKLEGLKRWAIDSVYYPPDDTGSNAAAVPEFSFTGTMYENGVLTGLTLDYGDFALAAKLEELEVYESGCE